MTSPCVVSDSAFVPIRDMTLPSGPVVGSPGEASENVEMGPPALGVQCGSAHIGGANSIRLDD
jgi:hypothetical protein